MDQRNSITKCNHSLKILNEKISALGYKTLFIEGNDYTIGSILIKTSDVTAESIDELLNNGSSISEETIRIIRKNCSKLNTGTCTATIQGKVCLQTGCPLPSIHCPMYNGNNNGSTSGTGNDSSSDNTALLGERMDNYIIRILANDNASGLFVHIVMIHNEECDLKLSFKIKDDAMVKNIIDTIVFLTT